MIRRGQMATLLLALALVLAGCGGSGTPTTSVTEETTVEATTATTGMTTTAETPAGSETTTTQATTTAADRETVQVTGGNLSVDGTEVFYRVQRLTGTDVRPQPVEIRNLTEWKGYEPGRLPVLQYLGMENLSLDPGKPGGLTRTSGKVYVHPGEGSPDEIKRILAHEFVHVVQYRANFLPWLSAIDQPRLTHDLLQTRLALIEGGAVYVTDAYADRHLDGEDPAGEFARRYENGSASAKYFYARYHLGHRYVRERVDSPEDLASVYENGPNTTEQLLHGYSRTEEPPADLSVSVNSTGRWSKTRNDTMGELFARVALQTELDADTARSAATGWGNDVLNGFTTGGEDPGFAWTLRMDSPGDADELASALETFAEKRRATSDGDFRVVRVGDETVVLVFGNPSLVESATVSGSNSSVTVEVNE